MDNSRFDTLARALVTGHTRRGLGWLLGGLLFSGPLALFGLAETEAKHKKKKPKPPDECHGLTTALEVVNGLTAQGIPIGESINFTAETDPNEILGRPGGYTSKVNFRDTRLIPKYDTIEPTDGGSVGSSR